MCLYDYVIQFLTMLNKSEDDLSKEDFEKLREKMENILKNYK